MSWKDSAIKLDSENESSWKKEAIPLNGDKTFFQKAAEAAYAIPRAGRTVGVGLERGIEGINPAKFLMPGGGMFLTKADRERLLANTKNAVERGQAAFQPGFQPQEGEKLGAFVGETAPLVAATLPLGGAGAALSGATGMAAPLAEGLVQGGIGAVLSALQQKSEEGNVSPGKTALAAGLSAAPGLAIEAARGIVPKAAGWFTKRTAAPYEAIAEDPQFLTKFKGTAESIEDASKKMLETFNDVTQTAKNKLNAAKELAGIFPDANAAKTPLKNIESIQSELDNVITHSKPTVKNIELDLIDTKTNQPFSKKIEVPPVSDGVRIKKLLELDQNLNALTQGENAPIKMTDDIHALKQKIQDQIREIPGGTKLQDMRDAYHDVLEVKNQLGRDLTDPGKSAAVMKNIVTGDIKGALNASFEKKKKAIELLEELGGKKVFEPLRNEILASQLKPLAGPYTIKGEIGTQLAAHNPVVGLVSAIKSSPNLMGKVSQQVGRASRLMKTPFMKALMPSGVSVLMSRRRENQ